MSRSMFNFALFLCIFILVTAFQQQKPKKNHKEKTKAHVSTVSYKKDVVPIFKKYCLPCHTEDQMNPSQLYLDNYDDMIKGGKHGSPIVASQPDSSFIVKKLSMEPPFGDPMPLKRKGAFPEDTLSILKKWIAQGANNN